MSILVKNQEPLTDITMNLKENEKYSLNKSIIVKAIPLMNSIEKATIESGEIKIAEIINDWCRIENDVEMGWIRTNSLKESITTESENVPEPKPEEPANTTEPEETNNNTKPEKPTISETETKIGYVSSDGLRVRKEPNTSSEEIDSLSKNAKLTIIGEEDGWYKIKIDGEIGYVSAKYVSDTKVPETTSRGGSISKTTQTTEKNTVEKEEETEQKDIVQTKGNEVVEYAKQYLGYKYVSGGASPSTGFDCSGFTSYIYKHFGITLNRTSKDQIKNGTAVERKNLQPGDIVIFNGESNKTIGHVGIYIGNGNFIHASNPKGGVKITELSSSYYNSRYVGARRVI